MGRGHLLRHFSLTQPTSACRRRATSSMERRSAGLNTGTGAASIFFINVVWRRRFHGAPSVLLFVSVTLRRAWSSKVPRKNVRFASTVVLLSRAMFGEFGSFVAHSTV